MSLEGVQISLEEVQFILIVQTARLELVWKQEINNPLECRESSRLSPAGGVVRRGSRGRGLSE